MVKRNAESGDGESMTPEDRRWFRVKVDNPPGPEPKIVENRVAGLLRRGEYCVSRFSAVDGALVLDNCVQGGYIGMVWFFVFFWLAELRRF